MELPPILEQILKELQAKALLKLLVITKIFYELLKISIILEEKTYKYYC